MRPPVRLIEAEYQARMAALSPKEKIARSMAMLKWTRDRLARQVITELGPMSDERLKWEVALRLYSGDAPAVEKIKQVLANLHCCQAGATRRRRRTSSG